MTISNRMSIWRMQTRRRNKWERPFIFLTPTHRNVTMAPTRNDNTIQIGGRPRGPWGLALEQLFEWDPCWAEICARMTTDPWIKGVLPRTSIELIRIAVNAACTHL